jgi:2-desacetyl-2-hydroxyethyl bacteriochlorophyllide A dehydrogenase
MKSAVLRQTRQIQVGEIALPEVEPEDVLIRVMACGICGTDVHIFEGDQGAAENPLPIVLGHEFAGIVERVGSKVDDFQPGERVCADPNVLCGRCDACKGGYGHFCSHMTGIGTTVNGGFAQFCAVPRQQLYRLSDNTPFTAGAMAEPLACCLHGIDQCEIHAGDCVVVIGGGMIGLLMLQLARISGAGQVILVEPVAEKRAVGQKLGANLCIDPNSQSVSEALAAAGIQRVNTAIECVGRTETIQQAIMIAGKKSVVMIFGLTRPDDEIKVRPFELFKKEIVLKASFINPYTMGRAVELINRSRVDVSSMVAELIPLERLGEVLASPQLRSKGKFIVEPWN